MAHLAHVGHVRARVALGPLADGVEVLVCQALVLVLEQVDDELSARGWERGRGDGIV